MELPLMDRLCAVRRRVSHQSRQENAAFSVLVAKGYLPMYRI